MRKAGQRKGGGAGGRAYPFTPDLGWSHSRYDAFQVCPRRYFYLYYPKFDEAFGFARISALKVLTDVPLEAGRIVHEAIAEALRRLVKNRGLGPSAGKPPAERLRLLDAWIEQAVRTATAEPTRFAETYYRMDGAPEDPVEERLLERARRSARLFLESERYAWTAERAARSIEGWIIEPDGFGETRIDGLKAYVKVDFALPDPPDFRVFDWKTGREEAKHADQLSAYAAWAAQEHGISAERVRPTAVYLDGTYREKEARITEEDVKGLAARVERETSEMKALCLDPSQNLPLPKERFSMTEDLRLCRRCNFRELCDRR